MERSSIGVRLAALVATAVAAAAVLPLTGAQATTPTELRRYLTQVTPLVTKVDVAERRVAVAAGSFDLFDAPATAPPAGRQMRKAAAPLVQLLVKLRAVKPPRDYRGLHGSLVQSVTLSHKSTILVANAYEDFEVFGVEGIEDALDRSIRLQERCNQLRKHWRTELTIGLRRAGIVVPLAVKNARC